MNRYSLQSHLSEAYTHLCTDDRRPVVGITANYGEQTAKLAEGYYKQVATAGATPLVIPPLDDVSAILDTLDRIDGLLLTGGADLNPLYMGEEPLPALGGINAERDLPELLITRLAFNRQMPILGICRGIQTLAVAVGGRVGQDLSCLELSSDGASHIRIKHSQDADRHVATHSISIVPDTLLYNIYSSEVSDSQCLYVNSFHHQAVAQPGSRFRVSATAPDGVIEAIESAEHKPVLGVQWHPECMGAEGRPLFRWLVDEAALYRRVHHVHDRVLTLDTHCDTPMFFSQGVDFSQRDDRILVDLPKMTEGRLDSTIMVAYIPQSMDGQGSPFAYANQIFDKIESIVGHHSSHLALARTPEELLLNKQRGFKSIMLGIENGLALEGNIGHVEHFARRGVVYITLCHNGDNDLCDSCRGEQRHHGVSDYGAKVIGEMNRLGLMVDLSHAHERSFFDALDISSTPIVCSHSSARALCNHPRNLTDEQMKALAKKGGVCQITLYPGFLRTGKSPRPTIIDALDHLEHAVLVMGIDHVGLGTDFDGDGGVPGLADASELLLFTRQLLMRRYSEEDISKIWGGNFLRVMKEVQQATNK